MQNIGRALLIGIVTGTLFWGALIAAVVALVQRGCGS